MNSVGIVGIGRAGSAMSYMLDKAGYDVKVVLHNKQQESINIGDKSFTVMNLTKLAQNCQVIFITTPDGIIHEVVKEMECWPDSIKVRAVFHMSGSLSSVVLTSLKKKGIQVGVLHPLQSLANVEAAVKIIPGSYFSFEGDEELLEWVSRLTVSIGANLITGLDPEKKALYHAGASIVSNFLVVLMNMGITCFNHAGFNDEEAKRALIPLMKGTLNNMSQLPVKDALTGPVVRGDLVTVEHHLSAIKKGPSYIMPAYQKLAYLAADIACSADKLDKAKCKELQKLLEGIHCE